MASPLKKQKHKEIVKHDCIRKAIGEACDSGKANIVIDAKPCSLEITRGRNNEYSWNIKLYIVDGAATFNGVSVIKQIDDEIRRQFK